jgi:hypothetical protein
MEGVNETEKTLPEFASALRVSHCLTKAKLRYIMTNTSVMTTRLSNSEKSFCTKGSPIWCMKLIGTERCR